MSGPVHPHIHLKLIGTDSHPMSIVAALRKSLRKGGIGGTAIDRIIREALSGDYDNVLTTTMKYVHVH